MAAISAALVVTCLGVRPTARAKIVFADGFSSYDALDVSDFHHVRIKLSERFIDERRHMNEIENFKQSFHLFLKECDLQFNGGDRRKLFNQLKAWGR